MRIDRLRKNMLFITVFCMLIFCCCGCGSKEELRVKEGMEHLIETESEAPTRTFYFGIYPEVSRGRIELGEWTDSMQFQIESAGIYSQFAVMIFMDYEQVPILVDGEEYEQYYVDVRGDYSHTFDFQLAKEPDAGEIHKLTGIMVAYSDVHLAEEDDLEYFMDRSIIACYDLVINNAVYYEFIKEAATEPESLSDALGSGIVVNCRMDQLNSFLPEKEVRVKAGETLTVQYHAGGFEENRFLLLAVAGCRQMKLDGQNYMYFDLATRKRASGYLQMETPEEPGSYEIIVYVIPEPFMEDGVSEQMSDGSYRFTLVVE